MSHEVVVVAHGADSPQDELITLDCARLVGHLPIVSAEGSARLSFEYTDGIAASGRSRVMHGGIEHHGILGAVVAEDDLSYHRAHTEGSIEPGRRSLMRVGPRILRHSFLRRELVYDAFIFETTDKSAAILDRD